MSLFLSCAKKTCLPHHTNKSAFYNRQEVMQILWKKLYAAHEDCHYIINSVTALAGIRASADYIRDFSLKVRLFRGVCLINNYCKRSLASLMRHQPSTSWLYSGLGEVKWFQNSISLKVLFFAITKSSVFPI